MECPKCGAEISKNTLVCPNCKKVLKIACPNCKVLNSGNVCRKCGKVLVTKCVKCGKINLLKNENCVKCGYSNEQSVIINESNSDDFAVLRIDFPNSDMIKTRLDSNKLYTKFLERLDKMILNVITPMGVRRQLIGKETYIIRFNKDYTLRASALNAINAVIGIITSFTKLNLKLIRKKKFVVRCNFTIMKRTVNHDPYDANATFKANILKKNPESDAEMLNAFQVVTDNVFYKVYNEDYELETLDSVVIDGRMAQIYEINVEKQVNINELIQEQALLDEEQDFEVPEFVHQDIEEQEKLSLELLNKNKDDVNSITEIIKFDQITANFITTEGMNVIEELIKTLQAKPVGIVTLKGSNWYQPYTLKTLAAVDEIGIYSNIIPITCTDDMKYTPYAFFRQLVATVFEYTVSQRLMHENDYTMFANIDRTGMIKDLISMNQRELSDLVETREAYCQAFLALLRVIPNTLIYIESFEKIDKSSMFILEQLFYHFKELNISYLISHDKNYTLHRNVHFLLTRDYYTEIRILPTPFKQIIEADKVFYENILTDFYFQRIVKYAYGSTLFLDYAIQYLIESDVYQYTDNSVIMTNPKTIMIPSSLEKLIQRRINILKDEKDKLILLATMTLIGTRVDRRTLDNLDIPQWRENTEHLADLGYIYEFNNCFYFANYTIIKEALLEILTQEELEQIAERLFERVYKDGIPSADKALLYEITNQLGEVIIHEWENLANVNISMGDYSAYLNCSTKVMQAIDKYADSWTEEEIEQYKQALCINVADNMFEYDPKESGELIKQAVPILRSMEDETKYYALNSKILQGDISHGNFINALTITHEVLSSLGGKASIDPASPNFDFQFLFMTLVYVKILFNLGAYSDCLDIGYNILSVLDSQKLETIQYSTVTKEEFKSVLIECIAYSAISIILTMREDVSAFLENAKTLLNIIPSSFEIFVQMQNMLMGNEVSVNPGMVKDNNPISLIIYHILSAFVLGKDKPEYFAQEIYNAKLLAKDSMLLQFEIFADIMIGFAYIKLFANERASAVLYRIIKFSEEKGMNAMVHLGWYVMSILNLEENKLDIAYGILNNSAIEMEKRGVISEYLTMLNKINMYKVLSKTGNIEQAEICLNQAQAIVEKYQIKLNIDIN